ncbi:unnamed protein product, partial [Laminaria digitata]
MTKRRGRKRARIALPSPDATERHRINDIVNQSPGTLSDVSGSHLPTASRSRPKNTAAAETILRLLVQSGLVASWTGAAELQRASIAVCEACRNCIPTKVRVIKETPSYLWTRVDGKTHVGLGQGATDARGNNGGEGGNVGGHYSRGGGCGGSSSSTSSRGGGSSSGGGRKRARDGTGGASSSSSSGSGGSGSASRLPPIQISSLVWERPAAQLGDGSLLPVGLRELTFGREFNKKLDGFKWPPKLERVTFGSKFNRDIAGAGARAGAAA